MIRRLRRLVFLYWKKVSLLSNARLFHILALIYGRDSIYFTNASLRHDGFGAQLQRVMSVAAFAKYTKINFVYSPLVQIEIQHGDFIRDPGNRVGYLNRCNEWVRSLIYSATTLPTRKLERFSGKEIEFINRKLILYFFRHYGSRPVLYFEIDDMYFYLNSSPSLYREVIRPKSNLCIGEKVRAPRIAIHARLATMVRGSERYLDPEVIILFLKEISFWSDSQIVKPDVFLFTDITLGKVDLSYVRSEVSHETMTLWQEMGIADPSGSIAVDMSIQLEHFLSEVREVYPEIIIRDKLEVTEALHEIEEMDLFIGSKSSFSFIYGLLARDSFVLMPEFWIRPLPHWVNYVGLKDSRRKIRAILSQLE
jgi:hypothetical protein